LIRKALTQSCAISDAALRALGDRRDLGVHSEMFSDGVLDLVERGVITGARKELDRGKIIASFVVDSRRLMDFLHDNPTAEMRPTDYTNNIVTIRRFDHMVAVNSAIQVDLTGQVRAESMLDQTEREWAAEFRNLQSCAVRDVNLRQFMSLIDTDFTLPETLKIAKEALFEDIGCQSGCHRKPIQHLKRFPKPL
jgi:hypothetical protein